MLVIRVGSVGATSSATDLMIEGGVLGGVTPPGTLPDPLRRDRRLLRVVPVDWSSKRIAG